ncbi:MAG: zinc-binding dehydrogenase [Actinomycetota bacterium]|nr:zinc-binding dehydrogenase [Actinomycetota bacterium]
MMAVWLRQFGGPEVLAAEESDAPAAGPGEALIEVHFVNVAFIETQLRSGLPGPYRLDLPVIPGNGVGGVVVSVGAGTDVEWVGKRVVASTGGSGGYAEAVAVGAESLIAVPEGLALDNAVVMLADGRTAMTLMAAAGPMMGERVLIEAAAGGVGTLLVQLAKAAGAKVVAAAGGTAKLALARRLGADVVVDYLSPDWTASIRQADGGLDVVFDGVGGAVAWSSFELIEPGGRMISFGLASGGWADISEETAADRGVTLLRPQRLASAENRAFTERALVEAAAGRLRPVVGRRFPLARASAAHSAIEARATTGRTLLDLSLS